MPLFSVIPERCRQDGICASVCPTHIIKGPKGKIPVMRPDSEAKCIACGHCMAFCPHGAARVDTLDTAAMLPLDRTLLPSPEQLEMLYRARRSIRHFKKEAVPRELLENILQAARHAPSAKNRRPLRWVAAYGAEQMRAIGDTVAQGLEWDLDNNPKPVIAESKGLLKAWRRKLDPIFRGAPHLVMAVAARSPMAELDSAIALTYLELAALSHNVGMCWAGYVTIVASYYAPLRELFGVGENERVAGGQMLGFIALRPTACAPRSPFSVHWL
jgi:Nitroreductase